MRLLLISHSYYPDQSPPQKRWQEFISRLREDSWDIDVVAPLTDGHDSSDTFKPKKIQGPDGETIHQVPSFDFFPDSRLGRLLKSSIQTFAAVPRALSAERPDIVVATVPAIPTLFSGWLISVLRRSKFVVDMRDAWPDLLDDADIRPRWISKAASHIIHRAQKAANGLISVTEGLAQSLRQRQLGPVFVIPNSAGSKSQQHFESRTRKKGELNVLYLGNHGESQNLSLLIRAGALARTENPEIKIRFVGSGTQREQLVALNDSLGNPVEMLPSVAQNEVAEHYRWADTCIVTLRPDWQSFQWTVPSKTYELLHTGKHLTSIVQGESARIIEEAGHLPAMEANVEVIAQFWLGLAENPDSTPISTTSIVWAKENTGIELQYEKLHQALNEIFGTSSNRSLRKWNRRSTASL